MAGLEKCADCDLSAFCAKIGMFSEEELGELIKLKANAQLGPEFAQKLSDAMDAVEVAHENLNVLLEELKALSGEGTPDSAFLEDVWALMEGSDEGYEEASHGN